MDGLRMTVVGACVLCLVVAWSPGASDGTTPPPSQEEPTTGQSGSTSEAPPGRLGGRRPLRVKVDGHGVKWWAARARANGESARSWRRSYLSTRRELLHRPDVVEAINLACATYGWCETLWRKARCETGGTFNPGVENSSGASGLFQFLPSTFASTPYARFSIWSPYASALAAGWMHEQGRGDEWTCR